MNHADLRTAARIIDSAIGDGYLSIVDLAAFVDDDSKVSFVAVDERGAHGRWQLVRLAARCLVFPSRSRQ
ncbi:MAG: hypothetical protein H7288_06960 [Kineosporiaceae bacterium]|nr:hypothetical protein [Aeromicrobium sp.]